MKNRKYYFDYIKCSVCGKLTAGRLPRAGNRSGDGSFYYPRRHKINGKDCKGNILEGEVINKSIREQIN